MGWIITIGLVCAAAYAWKRGGDYIDDLDRKFKENDDYYGY